MFEQKPLVEPSELLMVAVPEHIVKVLDRYCEEFEIARGDIILVALINHLQNYQMSEDIRKRTNWIYAQLKHEYEIEITEEPREMGKG